VDFRNIVKIRIIMLKLPRKSKTVVVCGGREAVRGVVKPRKRLIDNNKTMPAGINAPSQFTFQVLVSGGDVITQPPIVSPKVKMGR
jgi:hypothetical protein